MVVYFDDAFPPPYNEIRDGVDTCVALALLLAPPRYDGGISASVRATGANNGRNRRAGRRWISFASCFPAIARKLRLVSVHVALAAR